MNNLNVQSLRGLSILHLYTQALLRVRLVLGKLLDFSSQVTLNKKVINFINKSHIQKRNLFTYKVTGKAKKSCQSI